MAEVTLIDLPLCRQLSLRARENPRRRQNLNLHTELEAPSQRLLNALEPGTYVRPHRHLSSPRAETFVGLQGVLALCLFDDCGGLAQVVVFGPGTGVFGADVPPGAWHSVVCLEPGAVFFEAKDGPYRPLDDKDWPVWAPREGTPEAVDYLNHLQASIARRIDAEG